jgi:hypothetical protein
MQATQKASLARGLLTLCNNRTLRQNKRGVMIETKVTEGMKELGIRLEPYYYSTQILYIKKTILDFCAITIEIIFK